MNITKIPILSLDEKQRVRQQVKKYLIGDEPVYSEPKYISEYKSYQSYTETFIKSSIILVTFLFFIAAAYISGSHVYHVSLTECQDIGLDTQLSDSMTACNLIGYASVTLSETGLFMFSLMAAILAGDNITKTLGYFGATTAILLTLAANAHTTEFYKTWGNGHNSWITFYATMSWMAPPVMQLITAFIIERQLVSFFKTAEKDSEAYSKLRAASLTEYKESLEAYRLKEMDLSSVAGYVNKYWQVLEETLPRYYLSKGLSQEQLDSLTVEDWDQLIKNELSRDLVNRETMFRAISVQTQQSESDTAYTVVIDDLYHGKTHLNPKWITEKGYKRESSALKEAIKYEAQFKN